MTKIAVTMAALGALALAVPALADPAPAAKPRTSCFYSNQFENWRASDAKTMYIRVGLRRYYRLDLANSCHDLTWPSAYLITKIRGSNSICSPLDWDLRVAMSPHDIPEPCIVKAMTELTPDEVAAIPRKFKP